MNVEIQINNVTSPQARCLTWSLSPCRVQVADPTGIPSPQIRVWLRLTKLSRGSTEFATNAGGPYRSSLNLDLPRNGNLIAFFVRDVLGQSSTDDTGNGSHICPKWSSVRML